MAMKNRWLVLLVLLFFLLDGALFPWLLPQPRPDGFAVSPRLALAGILYAAMFRNRNLGLALGLVIGFMQDIVHHGPMLGVHAFGMAVSAYVVGTVGMKAKKGVLLPLVAMALGLVLHESIAFSLYLLFQTADLSWTDFAVKRLAPTFALNLFLAALLFVPARKLAAEQARRDEEPA